MTLETGRLITEQDISEAFRAYNAYDAPRPAGFYADGYRGRVRLPNVCAYCNTPWREHKQGGKCANCGGPG